MRPSRASLSSRAPSRPRLMLEQLEDRLVPGEALSALLLLPLQFLPDPACVIQSSDWVDGLAVLGASSTAARTGDDLLLPATFSDSTALDDLDPWADGPAAGGRGRGESTSLAWSAGALDETATFAVEALPGAWFPDANAGHDTLGATPFVPPVPLAEMGTGQDSASGAAVSLSPPSAGPSAGPAGVGAAIGAGEAGGATSWAAPLMAIHPQAGPGPTGYSPAQIRHAYGIDQLSNNGAGQTIAIVDAYNAPNIKSDVAAFNSQFGLPQFNTGGPTFTVVNQKGGASLPRTNAGWALEISLDVEWAHAIAPQANILLVEASSNSFSNLLTAVNYASSHAHVVSMSWGGSEFSSETSYDSYFNKSGVTFTAASGDNGTGVIYPAASPYVLSVGGTTLPLDAQGNLTGSETAWSGSGGGISANEKQPTYQANYLISATGRGVPDVSYDADPNTGFAVYDTTSYSGHSGWFTVGGTSAGAPQWAGLVALANQARLSAGKSYLASNSLTSSPEYSAATGTLYASNYRDIVSGSNGTGPNTSAGTGYDFVTGLGSPLANNLVTYLQSL